MIQMNPSSFLCDVWFFGDFSEKYFVFTKYFLGKYESNNLLMVISTDLLNT